MPRHAAFWVSLLLGAITLVSSVFLLADYAIGLSASAMFVGFLVLTALRIPHLSPDYLRKHAVEEDTPGYGIFVIVVVVVTACLVSLFMAINSGASPDPWLVVVSVSAVLLGWFTVQAMGALHYAYEYYEAPATGEHIEGGLDFPGDAEPDGYDFLYFSYTVGTSVATSDVKVTERGMRRIVTVHMIFSHLFNTIILAAAVNVLFSLGSG
jgi:uncharacterized membrane protein